MADEEEDMIARDNLRVDQMVDGELAAEVNRAPRNRRTRSCLCGLFKQHGNGHLDIMCAKDMHPDFLSMLGLVVIITTCLTLYACFI